MTLDHTAPVPCQACGRTIARQFARGDAKRRVRHKCPHGRPCPAGQHGIGSHLNGPLAPVLGGCLACWGAKL